METPLLERCVMVCNHNCPWWLGCGVKTKAPWQITDEDREKAAVQPTDVEAGRSSVE